ncbi:GFA family protein [Roseibium litorale]|nr:GFA family protein [Roseibium litorale]
MSEGTRTGVFTGGCQCGAVRFRVEGTLGRGCVCHCRMCQKAAGNIFLPLISVQQAQLRWTRGEPKMFRSSETIQRGFCADCGTPLTYQHDGGIPELTIGSFDHPEQLEPQVQANAERTIPWAATIFEKRNVTQTLDAAWIKTYQHPDHDTETWPQETSE